MSKQITITLNVRDGDEPLIDRIRSVGLVEWGATSEFDSAGHLEHLAETLRITAKEYAMPDKVRMHGVYFANSEIVLCHTGTSPNSGAHARLIVGLWNSLVAEIERLDRQSAAGDEPC